MLKFGSELRYGIRSSNVLSPVDIPIGYVNAIKSAHNVCIKIILSRRQFVNYRYMYFGHYLKRGLFVDTAAITDSAPNGAF